MTAARSGADSRRATAPALDRAFAALADPVRRAVIERLRDGPARAGELAAQFALSAPRMSQHLRVLRVGGLVEEAGLDSDARVRVYRLRPEPFGQLRNWATDIESFWNVELAAFQRHAQQRRRDGGQRKAGRRAAPRTRGGQ